MITKQQTTIVIAKSIILLQAFLLASVVNSTALYAQGRIDQIADCLSEAAGPSRRLFAKGKLP